ncbi:unnamed protein product [Ilex paraguariensis]|uniref:Uncharacterized protein n=1 Tax=Ilex paraguariensis TaxID=185542 RepID=A0ABC8RJD9_9AQUA
MIAAANSVLPTNSFTRPLSLHQLPNRVVCFNLGFGLKPDTRSYSLLLGRGDKMELFRKLSRGCFKFKQRPKKDREVEVESVSGGEDIFNAASAEAKVQPEHLVIMVNGIIGSDLVRIGIFGSVMIMQLTAY